MVQRLEVYARNMKGPKINSRSDQFMKLDYQMSLNLGILGNGRNRHYKTHYYKVGILIFQYIEIDECY